MKFLELFTTNLFISPEFLESHKEFSFEALEEYNKIKYPNMIVVGVKAVSNTGNIKKWESKIIKIEDANQTILQLINTIVQELGVS